MKTLMPLLLAALLTGCGLIQENAIRDEVLADPDTRYTVKEAIKEKHIMTGMTQREVIAAWGNPCGYCYGTRKSSEGETWEYNIFGSGRSGYGSGTYLYFDRKGRLRYWNKR